MLPAAVHACLDTIFAALDPIRLLQQMGRLQDALWQHAVVGPLWPPANELSSMAPVSFSVAACGMNDRTGGRQPSNGAANTPIVLTKCAYHRKQPQLPRWWRTRVATFAEVWTDIVQWLEAQPERTAKSVLTELQQRYPGQFPDVQLRTLRRRVACWRATMITTFDDGWLADEVLNAASLPRPLCATAVPDMGDGPARTL